MGPRLDVRGRFGGFADPGGVVCGCPWSMVVFLGARRVQHGLLRKSWKVLILSSAALVLGMGLWWTFGSSATAHGRLTGAFSSDPEAGRRSFLMKKTAQLAWNHPLLGVGPGAFRVWFPSVEVQGLAPAEYATQPYIISEHGHNDFLQMAADAGWPAALLWILMCALVSLRLFQGLGSASDGDDLLRIGALGALVALFVHGLANFPFQIVPTESAAWALAAVALRSMEAVQVPSESLEAWGWFRRWHWIFVGIVLASVLIMARDRQFSEEGLWWRGAGELTMKNAVGATPILLEATGMDRREDRIWSLHGQAQFDQGNIWQSIGSLREVYRLNPYDAASALRLALALMENRLYDEAEKVLSATVAYAPNLPELWEPLGAVSFQNKKFDNAIKAYDWMLYYHVDEEAAYTNKAAAQGSLNQLLDARRTLLEADQKFPNSGNIQVNLAITLYKMGLRKDAYQAWKKASVLTPSNPQVDFLRKVMQAPR